MKITLTFEPLHEARNWQRALIKGSDGNIYGVENTSFPHNFFLTPTIEIWTTSHYNTKPEAVVKAKEFKGTVIKEFYDDGFFVAFSSKLNNAQKVYDKLINWLNKNTGNEFSWLESTQKS